MGTRILITGVAGSIGSALADVLLRLPGFSVVGVDNLLTGTVEKLPRPKSGNFTFVQADVNDPGQVRKVMGDHPFDYVFHYAAVVGVERTLAKPVQVLNDIQGIRNVLDNSRDTGVKRVFYSSSSEVYGEPVEFPQNEATTPLNSRLPYAVVKNVGEAFLRSYHKEYNLDYTIFRFFNTYGPRQSEDFVISRFIKAAMEGRDLTVYGTGLQTRTFCYINDNIETTLNCLLENKFVNDVVNIGSDEEITIKDLAETIVNTLKSKSRLRFLPPLTEGDMTRRKPDITKMRSVIRRELTPLTEGIRLTAQNRLF